MSDNTVEGLMAKIRTCADLYASGFPDEAGVLLKEIRTALESLASQAPSSTPGADGAATMQLSELMRGLEMSPTTAVAPPQFFYEVGAAIARQAKLAASPSTPGVDAAKPLRWPPKDKLPSWEDCALRVGNSDYIAKRVTEGGYGPEHDSLLANELHRFIYEYDDSDQYKSAWFRHRLEKLITEITLPGAAGDGTAKGGA